MSSETRQLEINKMKASITEMIKNSRSTLSIDNEEDDFIYFATRENGDVGEEQFGAIDYDDAVDLKAKIDSQFGHRASTSVETVDEWVHLNVEFS